MTIPPPSKPTRAASEGRTMPFELGKSYQTQEGKTVTIVAVDDTPGYECVQGDDPIEEGGGWRYNRAGPDRGRVTGTAHDWSDPRDLIPARAASEEADHG
jgi:hypothetical protein